MNNKIQLYVIIALLPLLFQGCLNSPDSKYEKQMKEDDEAILTYLEENNIDAEKETSGVYFEILAENPNGKQVVTDHVVGILYTIRNLEDGTEIETYADTLNPLKFSNSYSSNSISLHPAGLNYEISEMKEGEKFRFFIPSYQAFSSYAHDGLFGPNTNFIIEVELAEVKTEEEIYEEEVANIQNYLEENEIEAESYPNGLQYIQVEEGEGKKPSGIDFVEFHFTRKYLDGTIIETTVDDEPIRVRLNNNELVEGLETGITLMQEGEKAELIMPSKLAFGKSVQVIPQQVRRDREKEGTINPLTRPYSPVIYEIELLSIN